MEENWMKPQELARNLKSLQNESLQLIMALIALNRDSSVLVEVLESQMSPEYTVASLQKYTGTLGDARNALERFCDAAGNVFSKGR